MIASILVLSVALQFVAAVMAFRLIVVTGERWAWGLISVAILLMMIRRCIPLFHMAVNGATYKADAIAELIALAISVLMVMGIARIAPLFRSVRQAEQEMRTLKDELEVRVSQRTSQLEAANEELEAFSYSVSHDLRVPLRAIDGFSHILLEDYAGKLDEEGTRMLKVVRDNTCRMGQLIDDMLRFSRTGRLELNFVQIDMDRLAREVADELKPASANSRLQLEIAQLPPVRGDRAMLHQVFVNLLSNAIKFSQHRAIPRVVVGGSIQGDEAVYYVRDNGAGFDMQYSGKLFGVFQRLHRVEEFDGTGLGLAIVKRIITRHGGRVWAEGKVNFGATLYFALPAAPANSEWEAG